MLPPRPRCSSTDFLKYVIHLTLNLMIYQKIIFRILLWLVLLRIKKSFKSAQLHMRPMKILKLELKLHMVAKITNSLNQEVVYFVKLHIYCLEKSWISRVQVRKILCSKFLWFNQRHFVSITLSWRCHVSFNFLFNHKL